MESPFEPLKVTDESSATGFTSVVDFSEPDFTTPPEKWEEDWKEVHARNKVLYYDWEITFISSFLASSKQELLRGLKKKVQNMREAASPSSHKKTYDMELILWNLYWGVLCSRLVLLF